jgi:sphingosine kinase
MCARIGRNDFAIQDTTMKATTVKRCLAIVNPQSGTRRGLAILEQVRPTFQAAGWELAVQVTEHPGHAQAIVRAQTSEGCDCLGVVGGDGTIHEAVNGLMERRQSDRIPLGFIPAGSGNTMHQHLHYVDPIEAARRITAGITCPLDAMRVTMGSQLLYSVDTICWGGAADINRQAERWRRLGPCRYAAAALWQILRARGYRAKVTLDGRTIEDEFLFVIVCNPKFTGKGMKMAPRAEIGDGKIDVIMVRQVSRLQMTRLFLKVFDGSHVSMKCVDYRQARSLAIESADRMSLAIDGEMKGHAPFRADVMPGALRVFTEARR